jgi:hypothetical protein
MFSIAKKPLVAAGAAALALGLAAPATAATATFEDSSGDVAHPVDLQSVKVVNEKNVRIVLQHDDLRRSFKSGASGEVFLDTDPSRKGPEYVFTGGYFEGADYALIKTDGWTYGRRAVPLTCSYEMHLDYAADTTRMRISRGCLGNPGKVRVAVKVGGEQADGDIVRDWLGSRRELTPWVARG